MEGFSRAKKAFRVNICQKMYYSIASFFYQPKRLSQIRFHNKFMRVKQAVEPDLILWQNFGVSKKSRFFRTIIFILFTIMLLMVCFYGILLLEHFIQKTEVNFPSQINCNTDVTKVAASADAYNFIHNRPDQTGDFFCFCQNMYNQYDSSKLKEIKF